MGSVYQISEVDPIEYAETIHSLNNLAPDLFKPLERKHLDQGYWWLVFAEDKPVGFAGLVPFDPFPRTGYLKRSYILPDHRGHGLQLKLIERREAKARNFAWRTIVSESEEGNDASAKNFRRAGYELCEPERPWAEVPSLYWVKHL